MLGLFELTAVVGVYTFCKNFFYPGECKWLYNEAAGAIFISHADYRGKIGGGINDHRQIPVFSFADFPKAFKIFVTRHI